LILKHYLRITRTRLCCITICTLGNNDLYEENSIAIYPNPVIDIVTIKTNNSQLNIKTIEVFDLLGKKVVEQLNSNYISLKKLAKGTYFIKIETDLQKTVIKRIIKQ